MRNEKAGFAQLQRSRVVICNLQCIARHLLPGVQYCNAMTRFADCKGVWESTDIMHSNIAYVQYSVAVVSRQFQGTNEKHLNTPDSVKMWKYDRVTSSKRVALQCCRKWRKRNKMIDLRRRHNASTCLHGVASFPLPISPTNVYCMASACSLTIRVRGSTKRQCTACSAQECAGKFQITNRRAVWSRWWAVSKCRLGRGCEWWLV